VIVFRRLLLGAIYLSALLVAGALVVQSLQYARQWPSVFTSRATPTPVVIVATPTVAPTPVAMITLPTVTQPTPLPAPEAAPEQVSYHPKSGRYVVAWLPPIFDGGARASFEANKDIIDDISPFWYVTDGSGQLYGNRDDNLVRIAHENNIRIIPTIHNVGEPAAVVRLLSDPQRRARHIQIIVDEVLARNYDGIDIDYESLAPSMREPYSAFIRELAAALHPHNKLLTVAVHAKDSDWGGLGGFQDWVEIGKHVDQLRIMTYDYHWRGSTPGPVAPLYWIQSVAEYATSVVDPGKVLIGVHFYGYDWPPNGNATARPWSVIEDMIAEQGATLNRMERDANGPVDESYFFYNSAQGRRTVWFMTDSGLESKLDTVHGMDLGGIAIWQLGYEKPEYWDVIRESLAENPWLIQRAINPLLPEH
jgi:spore germination protein YaaH